MTTTLEQVKAEHRVEGHGYFAPDVVRFLRYCEQVGDCWHWTKNVLPNGYSQWTNRGASRAAHLHAYTLLVGPIPSGMLLDHLCHTQDLTCRGKGADCLHRRCVNPAHLEPVTPRENLLRTNTFQGINAAKTECLRGHPFDEVNTKRDARGNRVCRQCRALYSQWAAERRRSQREAARRPAA